MSFFFFFFFFFFSLSLVLQIVAIKPQSVLAQAQGDDAAAGAAADAGAADGGLFARFSPQYCAAVMAVVVAMGAGANFLSAMVLIGVGMLGAMVYADPRIMDGRLGRVDNPVERICAALHRATGVIVTPNHLAAVAAGVVGTGWYFYLGPGSHGHGYQAYNNGGYGSYGGGGGGYSFYYLMSVVMLFSYLRRMGTTPYGWDINQFWHSLQNIDLWQGMMLLNMVQRVLNGGGGRRRMF